MRSLFVGLVAAVMALTFAGQLLAQGQLADDAAFQKALEVRTKNLEAVAKGDRRAVAAEEKLKAETATIAASAVAGAKLPCTVTDSISRAAWGSNNVIEVACREGIGYMLAVVANNPPQALECIETRGVKLPVACSLPANANPAKGLQPFVTRAGSDCVVERAMLLAASPNTAAYEIACASGIGQILTVGLPRSETSRTLTAPCVAIANVLPNVTCTLTTAEANMAPIKALATKSDRNCPLRDQRYVGAASNGAEYYEFACQDGSGFMIQATAKGEVQRTIGCLQATGIAGGCTLTDTSAAMASQMSMLTQAAKSSGIDCQVNKFANFPARANSTAEAAELTCGNRPEMFVSITNNGKTAVMNCMRAQLDGYRCSNNKPEDSYKALTEDLKQLGRQTCEVSGARPLGSGSRAVFLEVACSDGAPGFILSYPTGETKPDAATACSQVAAIGGGCQMAENKRG